MGRRRQGPFKVYPREDSDVLWVRYWIGDQLCREPTGETDRGAAEERAAEIWQAAKARAGDPVGPDDAIAIPLTRYAARLVDEVKTLGRADSYARDIEIDLRLHILPHWKTAASVTSLDWEQRQIDLHAKGLGWASVKRVGKHLRMLLRFCMRKGAIVNVPEILSPAQELIDREQVAQAGMSREDRDAFLSYLARRGNHRVRRIYEVMFFNLYRQSTVQRITPAWLNLKEQTIRVPASKAKNSTTRVYWLHPRTMKALQEQIAANTRAERRKKRSAVTVDLTKPIFGKFDNSTVFWTACKKLGLVTFTPAIYDGRRCTQKEKITDKRGLTPHHVTRRTAATMLVEAGVSTKDRMAAGGWETVEAAERYDLPKEQLERSRRALRKLR